MRGKHVPQRGGQFVAVRRRIRPGQVDVDDEDVGMGSGDIVDGIERCRQPRAFGRGGYQVQLFSCQFVVAGDEADRSCVEGLDVFERADLVVLTRDHLEQRAGIRNSLCQKVDQRFWSCDEASMRAA